MDEIVFRRIYDVVVKTILSIEVTVSSAVERFVQDRHNCFSLLGFVLGLELLSPTSSLITLL